MSARDDYPILVEWLNGVEMVGFNGDAMEIAVSQALDEIDQLRELLRQHITDWGKCDHPSACQCSDARARRAIGMPA